MQPSEKAEGNAHAHEENEARAQPHQSIARLQETMQSFLAQPGVDLRQPNLSSDSQNCLQNLEQNSQANDFQNEKVPLEQIEREAPPETSAACARENDPNQGTELVSAAPHLAPDLGVPAPDCDVNYMSIPAEEKVRTDANFKAPQPTSVFEDQQAQVEIHPDTAGVPNKIDPTLESNSVAKAEDGVADAQHPAQASVE